MFIALNKDLQLGLTFSCVGVSGFGLDYLPAGSSAPEPNSWHQSAPTNSWAPQDMPMDDSSTVLLDSFKVGFPVTGQVFELCPCVLLISNLKIVVRLLNGNL